MLDGEGCLVLHRAPGFRMHNAGLDDAILGACTWMKAESGNSFFFMNVPI